MNNVIEKPQGLPLEDFRALKEMPVDSDEDRKVLQDLAREGAGVDNTAQEITVKTADGQEVPVEIESIGGRPLSEEDKLGALAINSEGWRTEKK